MCSTHRDIWCPARAHQQDRDTAPPPIKKRIPDTPQTLKTEKCLGGGWAGGDSAVSRNGAESAVSQNEADSAVSRNRADSVVSRNGTDSAVSRNGADSADSVVSRNGADSAVSQNGADSADSAISRNGADSAVSRKGADSAVSRNRADSAISRNGADSAVSQNGVDSWVDSGVDSVASQNGAGSAAYSTLKAEPLKFSWCTPPVTPRGANKAYGTWRARLGLPRKRPWGRPFFVADWRATPTKSKSSAGCTLC